MGGSTAQNSVVTVGAKPKINWGIKASITPTASVVMQFIGYPIPVLVGRKLQIFCRANGTPRPKSQWTKNGRILVSSRRMLVLRDRVVIAPVDESHAGQYTCIVSNVVGTDQMSSVVDVLTPPTIKDKCHLEENMLVIGLNSSFPAGQSLGLCCPVAGNPNPQLIWHKGPEKMTWNDSMLMIKNATINDSGLYSCSGINKYGRDSRNSMLTVTEPVSVTVIPQGHVAIFAGQSVEIICSAVGHPQPTMQWLIEPDGTPIVATNRVNLISVADGLKLAVNDAEIKDSRTFSCAATDYYGETIKESISFVVNL
jgi:hypothetical protein